MRGYDPERGWRGRAEIEKVAKSGFHNPGFANAHRAADHLRVTSLRVLSFPDTRFEQTPMLEFAHEVEEALDRWEPSIVYTHHGGDLNMDHRWVHQAVVAATRPKPGSCVEAVYFWETLSATEWAMGSFDPFRPTCFVPLAEHDQAAKERVLSEVYGAEMRSTGHPRSIPTVRAQAVLRGATCGHALAEAFQIGRIIQ